MQDFLQLAKDRITAGKREGLIRKALSQYFEGINLSIWKATPSELCNTCDTLVDDGTCPECNGEGSLKPEYIPLTVEDVTSKVDKYLEQTGYTKAQLVKSKAEALNTLTITHNTIAYDADGRAIGNMGAVVSLANFKFNKLLAQGTVASEAYKMIYKDTNIGWKSAKNTLHNVQIESIAEALEKGMNSIADVIGAK